MSRIEKNNLKIVFDTWKNIFKDILTVDNLIEYFFLDLTGTSEIDENKSP